MEVLRKISINLIFCLILAMSIFVVGENKLILASSNEDFNSDTTETTEFVVEREDNLPSYYSLRDEMMIFSKNQDVYGLCWDYTTLTVLETCIAKNTGEYYNFSEGWLAVGLEHYVPNRNFGGGFWFINLDKLVDTYNGLMLESDFPYTTLIGVDNNNADDYYNAYCNNAIDLDNYTIFSGNKSWDNYNYLDDSQESEKQQVRDEVKTFIKNNGALGVNILFTKTENINGNTCLPFTGKGESHATTIIGWDDNVDLGEYGKGAWIILNSYGEGYSATPNSHANDCILYIPYDFGYSGFYSSLNGFIKVNEQESSYVPEVQFDSQLSNGNYVIHDKGVYDENGNKSYESGEIIQKNIFAYGSTGEKLVYTLPLDSYTVTKGDIKVIYEGVDVTEKFDIVLNNNKATINHLDNNLLEPGTYKILFNGVNSVSESKTWVKAFVIMSEVGFGKVKSKTFRFNTMCDTQITGQDEIVLNVDSNDSAYYASLDLYFSTYSRLYDLSTSSIKIEGSSQYLPSLSLSKIKSSVGGGYVDGLISIQFSLTKGTEGETLYTLSLKGKDQKIYTFNLKIVYGPDISVENVPGQITSLLVNVCNNTGVKLTNTDYIVAINKDEIKIQLPVIEDEDSNYIIKYWTMYYGTHSIVYQDNLNSIVVNNYVGESFALNNYATHPDNYEKYGYVNSILLIPTIEERNANIEDAANILDNLNNNIFDLDYNREIIESGNTYIINQTSSSTKSLIFNFGVGYVDQNENIKKLGVVIKALDIDEIKDKINGIDDSITVTNLTCNYTWYKNFVAEENKLAETSNLVDIVNVSDTGTYICVYDIVCDYKINNQEFTNEKEMTVFKKVSIEPKVIYVDVSEYNLTKLYDNSLDVPEAIGEYKSLNEILNSSSASISTGIYTNGIKEDVLNLKEVYFDNSKPSDFVEIIFTTEGDNASNYVVSAGVNNDDLQYVKAYGVINKQVITYTDNLNDFDFVDYSKDYDARNILIEDIIVIDNFSENIIFKVQKLNKNTGEYENFEELYIVDSGDYRLVIDCSDIDHEIYEITNEDPETLTVSIDFKINTIKEQVEWSSTLLNLNKTNFEYTGEDYYNTFTAKGLQSSLIASVKYEKLNKDGEYEEVAEMKTVGVYKLTATSINQNYVILNNILEIVITPQVINNVWSFEGINPSYIQASNEYHIHYTGNSFMLLDAGIDSLGFIYTEKNNVTYTINCNGQTVNEIKNAGIYVINAIYKDSNYTLEAPSITFVVDKKVVEVDWIEVGLVLDQSANSYYIIATGDNLLTTSLFKKPDGLVTLKVKLGTEEVIELRNKGNYTLILNLTDEDNYIFDGNVVEKSIDFEVRPNKLEIQISDLLYNKDTNEYYVEYAEKDLFFNVKVFGYNIEEELKYTFVYYNMQGQEVSSNTIRNAGKYDIELDLSDYNDNNIYEMTGVKNITLLVLPQTLDESNIWWNVQTTNGVYYKEYNAETLNLLWATNKNSAIFTTTYWKKIEDEYVKLNSVADTKNVGEYKIIVSVNDNYTIEDSKTTELNVVVNQKYIKVVASSLTDEESLGYYDKENIPSLDNLIYNIYDSEEDKWKKENLKFKLVYKSTEDNSIVEIDKIKEEWDNWTYKDGVVQPKNYIIYIERRSDLENYIIDYRDGVMTIEKKSFSVIFQIDGKYSVSKTFLQTELIVAPDLSFAPNITTSTKLTNWYLNGNEVSDISSIKLNKNITLNKYTIYTITYEINSATEENPVYEFHKEKKSVNEHPLKDYDSKLSKFGYEFKGWASTNGNILDYYSINTTGLEKDMVLRPQYETKKYNIVLASVKITEELDKNGNIVKVESKPSEFARETFTIVDYDSNQLITLDGQEIVEEGFIFKNWYYNNVKLENGSFRLSEIIERSDLDNLDSNGIQIIAKFEVLKCVVVLMVGNTPIKNISYDIGDNIDKDDLMSLIDRKFGYLYVMEDVPDVVNSSSIIVIRVSEIPFLYISLGVIVILGGLVTLLVVIIRKKKLAKDKKELDTILNHLD